MDIRIVSEPDAPQSDSDLIEDGINEYNMNVTGDRNYHPVKIFLRDEHGKIHGGLTAHIWGGWMYIDFVWLDESLRGQDYGTQLVQMAEDEARAHGCYNVYLNTFSFQARPFYEKLGYEVYGQLDNFPPGETHFYLRKVL